MADVAAAVAIGALTLLVAYLGVHLTMHPAETKRSKFAYKVAFFTCGVGICVLIGVQARQRDTSQEALLSRLKRIEAETLAANAAKTLPSLQPPAASPSHKGPRKDHRKEPPNTPRINQPPQSPPAKEKPKPPAPNVRQFSEGPCSPNIVGNNNSTNCAPKPELTATQQLQQKLPSGEWLTSFTVSSNVLIQTGDLRLLCDGPVLRAGISRVNPAEFISGGNGPNPSNPDEAIYQLGPEMLSPGAVVVIGVYSNKPVHVISGSLGQYAITFQK